jgi:hypothetical protein
MVFMLLNISMELQSSKTVILHHHECSLVETELEAAQQLYDFLENNKCFSGQSVARPDTEQAVQTFKTACINQNQWKYVVTGVIGIATFNRSLRQYYTQCYFACQNNTPDFPLYNKNYVLLNNEPGETQVTILGCNLPERMTQALASPLLSFAPEQYDTADAIQKYIQNHHNSAKKIIIHHHDEGVVTALKTMQPPDRQTWEVKCVPKGTLMLPPKPVPLADSAQSSTNNATQNNATTVLKERTDSQSDRSLAYEALRFMRATKMDGAISWPTVAAFFVTPLVLVLGPVFLMHVLFNWIDSCSQNSQRTTSEQSFNF